MNGLEHIKELGIGCFVECFSLKLDSTLSNRINEIYFSKMKKVLQENEIKQLENWTNKKCHGIVFDSNKDDWSIGNSCFDEKVLYRRVFVVMIESEDGEKFGYYYNYYYSSENEESFAFNLESNGRFKQPMKFKKIKELNHYKLFQKKQEELIIVGNIKLFKENVKEKSCIFCCQCNCCEHKEAINIYGEMIADLNTNCVDMDDIHSHYEIVEMNSKKFPVHRKYFIPKRILVIQMN